MYPGGVSIASYAWYHASLLRIVTLIYNQDAPESINPRRYECFFFWRVFVLATLRK
ncbi:hypothetical protein KSD_35410 [Ktedonobacter sp. SOSP1-85]|nr:hypothetical protein KSD_35410 [Ktedonobacter sp. SOSP1-85]